MNRHTQGESPLSDLFCELQLLVLSFLDARSLHAMLLINRSFNELNRVVASYPLATPR